MKKTIFLLSALLTVFAVASQSQTATLETGHASKPPEQARTFFPHNWVRGYTDFEVAPSHNEPDLGRCEFPPPSGTAGTCCGGTTCGSAPDDLHTHGPYGLYATFGVRWSFGGYGSQQPSQNY